MKDQKSFPDRLSGFILLAAFTLLTSGCVYEIDNEVISAGMAEYVYNLPNTYYSDDNKTRTVIAAVPNSNDYRFQQYYNDKLDYSGYLRGVRLRDNIYIVQIDEDEEGLYIGFYEFGNGFYDLWPNAGFDEIKSLAGQYGIELDYCEYCDLDVLIGSSSNIMNFLRAHSSMSFNR